MDMRHVFGGVPFAIAPGSRRPGQLRDIRQDDGGKPLPRLEGVGSSGRIRTYNPPVNSRMLYP